MILYIPNATKVKFSKNFKNSFIVIKATIKATINPTARTNRFAFVNS